MVTKEAAESGQLEGVVSVTAGLSKLNNSSSVPTTAATVAYSVVPVEAANVDG
jgi:hypothetical protein